MNDEHLFQKITWIEADVARDHARDVANAIESNPVNDDGDERGHVNRFEPAD